MLKPVGCGCTISQSAVYEGVRGGIGAMPKRVEVAAGQGAPEARLKELSKERRLHGGAAGN